MAFSYPIGIIAGICFVIGYALLNFRVLSASSPIYQSLNLFGALGFTYTAISPFNPGLFITEAVWAIVAFYGLYKIWFKRTPRDPESGGPAAPGSTSTA